MRNGMRSVDANLLLALHALLEERNLTHAGARLAMSQPAMSGALARLRAHFEDDLLVRNGRDFELTELAQRLRPAVAEAVASAESLLGEAKDFTPQTSCKRFTISLSGYAMTVLAEPLTTILAAQAPGCSMAFDTLPVRKDFEAYLLRRDLVIVPLGFDFPGNRQPVFTDHLVCLVARTNPWVHDGALTMDDLAAMPHAVAEFIGAAPVRRPLEITMERSGLPSRNVQVTVTSLLTLPYAIAGTELCAFVPLRLARRCLDVLDLVVVRTPLPEVKITESAHWHPSRSADPAGRWLRRLMHDVAVHIEDQEVVG